ncbi:MAG TPA: DUF4344 domain-containing metallopeptidase [Sphingomicrobium sp.]|jgi:uncharacterized membrane protein|nr:DUF4344 domain-containing metallopeptidase [Sphingomicrobium sp.]
MKLAIYVRMLAFALLGLACLNMPAHAQRAPGGLIRYEYVPPMSLRYLPTVERLKQFRLLEQLSEFFSPVRLPYNFSMTTAECGAVNAYYSPSQRKIVLCYELVEAIERSGPKVGEPSEFSYQEVVVGSIVGVLLHELGHAVFDMIEVPVLGREEDAADAIATFIALQFSKDVARTVVRGTAYLHKEKFSFYAPTYWDEHGTGLQRYYNSLCIAYGGAPDLFKELVAKSGMLKSRADNCEREYKQVEHAFKQTLLPYVDPVRMKQVQSKTWLNLTPQQVTLLQQQQRQEAKIYSLSVCNLGEIPNVSAAILIQPLDNPKQWVSLGWFNIPNGGCNLIGSFSGDRAYLYAEGNNGKSAWRARDDDKTAAKQCIHPENAFEIVATTRCQPGQVARNFVRIDLEPGSTGFTWRLK